MGALGNGFQENHLLSIQDRKTQACPPLEASWLQDQTKKRGKQKEKIPNQRARGSKKKKKENSRSWIGIKIEEICRKVFGSDNI